MPDMETASLNSGYEAFVDNLLEAYFFSHIDRGVESIDKTPLGKMRESLANLPEVQRMAEQYGIKDKKAIISAVTDAVTRVLDPS